MDVLTINPSETEIAGKLPRFRLSFGPYVDYLNALIAGPTNARTPLVQYLIRTFSAHPHLLQPFDDIELATAHPDLLQLLELSVLPLVAKDRHLAYGFGVFEPLRLFHYSEEFRRLVVDDLCRFDSRAGQPDPKVALRFIYQLILGYCYGASEFLEKPVSYSFQHEYNSLMRYYRIQIDYRFVRVLCPTPLPVLQPAWLDFANGKIDSVAALPVTLPVDQFELDGFYLLIHEDVTQEAIINELKETLLHLHSQPEATVYDHFGEALQNLLGQPDVSIGMMPFVTVNDRYVHHAPYTTRSLFGQQFISAGRPPLEGGKILTDYVTYATDQPQPAAFTDLPALIREDDRPGWQPLLANGFGSFGLYPVRSANGVLGVVEVGSTRVGAVDDALLARLDSVMPLITELLTYQIESFNEQLERLIKQKFTPLQPSVEWKFAEVAWAYLQTEHGAGQEESIGPVAFRRVYPIYGAIDVRNSSQARYTALQHDLTAQLTLVDTLLADLNVSGDPESLAALQHRNRQFMALITDGVGPEEEARVATYIEQALNPFLREAASGQASGLPRLSSYFGQLNPDSGQFYQARQAFEDSLQHVNTTLETYLDREEKYLRTIYPYYFEKYRTDGLEYNLYIGQSLHPKVPFRPAHLQRVRFWQLRSMISVAVLVRQLQTAVPLQTTQLILAHTQPLDIAFRRDEQRFDVEGAYSIRYEVIKKRIDKAFVKDTDQRLVQPDTVAIVYANGQAVEEYVGFIRELQREERLLPGIEYLELDTLQGISGFKALRVRVNYDATTD